MSTTPGAPPMPSHGDAEALDRYSALVPTLLLMVCVVVSYVIQRYNVRAVQPSGAALIVGVAFGAVARAKTARGADVAAFQFSPQAFFYGLLPIIIYSAGLNLKRRDFFADFFTIALFAFVGTVISSFVFGLSTFVLVEIGVIARKHLGSNPLLECLLYGTLISSTDPVATLSVFADVSAPPLLYNLVFGESVLNDAVAVVLFRTLAEFYEQEFTVSTFWTVIGQFILVSIGSLLIGIAIALGTALLLKTLGLAEAPPNVAASYNGTAYTFALLLISGYFSYVLAENVGMSGIMSIFFTGIGNAHYSYHNVGEEAQIAVFKSFEAAAFLSETFVFAYLGMQVATFDHLWDFGILLTGIPLAMAARAVNIFPLSRLANTLRETPIPRNVQVMHAACGLRGAVAYALAVNMPSTRPGEQGSRAVETGTLVICLVSTLVLGGATLPLMKHLGLHDPSDREGMVSSAMSATAHDGLGFINPSPRARAVRARALADGHPIWYISIAFRAKARLFEWWDDLENNFMIPTFGGAPAHGAWSPVNTSDAGGSADAHETTPANGEEYRDVELTPIGDDDEKDLENLRAAGPSSDDA
jgi:sodium/hydrogen exchanger 3